MNVYPTFIRSVVALVLLASLPGLRAQDMKSFTLPWNDSKNTVTSLKSWNAAPAGGKGWVTVSTKGQFVVNGKRIRFLGVNVGAGAAFPDKDKAASIAKRMRKFGINAVRFHHMDAAWMAGDPRACLIDYETDDWGNPIGSDPKKLRPEALDRLQYFISELAKQGIYSNINLLTGRQYFASDGLPAEVEEMAWADQHVLGFFNDKARKLQEDFATRLLTAPDKYSKVPLAKNPALAFVEINNEMGFVQKWMDGGIDLLPKVFKKDLEKPWNAWLKSEYSSESALKKAWGAVDEKLGKNLLKNGAFASGAADWNVEQHSPAVRTFEVTKDYSGSKPSLKVVVSQPGSAGWHVQVNQAGLSLKSGQVYTVTFAAKASTSVPLTADLTYAGPTLWDNVQSLVSTTLGTSWKTYTAVFVAPVKASNLRINFSGFGSTKGTVWIADVKFSTGGKIGQFPSGVSLKKGNIPIVAYSAENGASLPNQRRDWIKFMVAQEQKYWKTMRDHLKKTIGYRGIVFGTIISTSTPNAQAGMDVVDTHSYWEHPQFPGDAWDSNNWLINNRSIVNHLDNALTGLAVQRVKGKPHMVTEYQHASPNLYGAEAPVLLAAYAGLQDWDGIWMFSYGSGTSDWNRGYVSDFFAQDTHPSKMANLLLASALFRRGDVAPAKSEYVLRFRPTDEVKAITKAGNAWKIADGEVAGYPARLTLQKRFALAVGSKASGKTKLPSAPKGKKLTSDTKELAWDTSVKNRGIVTVNTKRTKAVVGFANGRSFNLGGVVFKPGKTRNDWSTAGLVLTKGSSIFDQKGSTGVLVVTGEVANTGQKWTDSTKSSVGSNWGKSPTLVEVVPMTVTLPAKASGVKVYALDSKGVRKKSVKVKSLSDGRSQFKLGSSGTTLWYEVKIAKGAAMKLPTIKTQPKAVTVKKGASVKLTVKASGTKPLKYQWYKDGKAISGAKSSTYKISKAKASSAASYTVKVSNPAGSVTSKPAKVKVK